MGGVNWRKSSRFVIANDVVALMGFCGIAMIMSYRWDLALGRNVDTHGLASCGRLRL